MSWKEEFYGSVLTFLRTQMNLTDAVQVTGLRSEQQERGYCDTCGYSVTVIEITYLDSKGVSRIAEWEGEFSELIRNLED